MGDYQAKQSYVGEESYSAGVVTSPIDDASQQLEKTLAGLRATVGQLRERLVNVTVEERSLAEGVAAVSPDPIRSPLNSWVRRMTEDANDCERLLRDVLNRLEL